MVDLKTYIRHFDYALLAAVSGLIGLGLLMIYSATHSDPDLATPLYYVRVQGIATFIGSIGMIIVAFIDFRSIGRFRVHIYVGIVAMILLVTVMGTTAMGGQRWINLGFFNLQPSELAKVGMILLLSSYLADRQRGEQETQTTLTVLGLALVVVLLVFVQPDMGTALVLTAVTLALLFVYGTRMLHFAIIGVIMSATMFFIFKVLPLAGIHIFHSYQVDRLLVFINPDYDPGGSGYHLLQSKIAIGSGMMTGKGLYQGTQTQLNFLPEHHTDFIFSVIGEELGFLGAAVLLMLYVIVIWRALRIAMISDSMFGSLIAGGILSMLLFQVFVNIGMTIGIMPITGIPLPLVSYGGSSMVANLLAIGLLESIHVRSRLTGDRRYMRAQNAD
ncbi:MAG: rod shape-determining protein RodA [Thermoleophilia bacterium]